MREQFVKKFCIAYTTAQGQQYLHIAARSEERALSLFLQEHLDYDWISPQDPE